MTAHLSDKSEDESEFFINSYYNNQTFYSILIDTRTIRVSTTGILQVRSLQRRISSILIDESTKEHHYIIFRKNNTNSINTIIVPTPIRDLRFQIILLIIPFLLYLNDIDRLNVTFDNIKNILY